MVILKMLANWWKNFLKFIIIVWWFWMIVWMLNYFFWEWRNSARATDNTVYDKIDKEKPTTRIEGYEFNQDNHALDITTTGSNTTTDYKTTLAVQDASWKVLTEYPYSWSTKDGKISIPMDVIPENWKAIALKCTYIGNQRLVDWSIPECTSSLNEIINLEKPNYIKIRILWVDATFEDDNIKLTTARKFFEDKGSNFYSSYSVGKNTWEWALRIDSKKLFPWKKILFIFIDNSIFPKGSSTYKTIVEDLKWLYPHLNEVKIYSIEDIYSALDMYNESNDVRYILSYIWDCDNTVTWPCDEWTSYVRKFSKKLLKNNNINVFFIVPATTETIRNQN